VVALVLVGCGGDPGGSASDDPCGTGVSGSCVETRGEYCINYEATPLACNGAVTSFDEDTPCDRRFAVGCCRIGAGTDAERVKLYNAPFHDLNSATRACNLEPGMFTELP